MDNYLPFWVNLINLMDISTAAVSIILPSLEVAVLYIGAERKEV